MPAEVLEVQLNKRFICVLAIIALACCLLSLGVNAAKAPKTLELLCAPALRPAMEDAMVKFQKQSGVKCQVSYEAANILLGQLKLRSHGDVYLPADRTFIDQGMKARLVNTPVDYAYLIPVIMVAKNNPYNIRSVADLTNRKIKVGLVDERTGAIGKISARIFKKNYVDINKINVVYRAAKIDELYNAMKLKSVDAVIIWKVVAMMHPKDGEIIEIPLNKNIIATVSGGVVNTSKNKTAAVKFLKFLKSSAGQSILKKHHFTTKHPGSGKTGK